MADREQVGCECSEGLTSGRQGAAAGVGGAPRTYGLPRRQGPLSLSRLRSRLRSWGRQTDGQRLWSAEKWREMVLAGLLRRQVRRNRDVPRDVPRCDSSVGGCSGDAVTGREEAGRPGLQDSGEQTPGPVGARSESEPGQNHAPSDLVGSREGNPQVSLKRWLRTRPRLRTRT